jgi:hypothetical protein
MSIASHKFYGAGKKDDSRVAVPEATQQVGQAKTPLPDMTPEADAVGGKGIVFDAAVGNDTTMSMTQSVIGEEEVREARSVLEKYKAGKNTLENRVIKDQLYWELRNWEAVGKGKPGFDNEMKSSPKSTSAWLFNAVINKHSDAMDNYPEPLILPREQSDEESAKILKSILPVVLEQNGFRKTYRSVWWDKLVQGTGIYGVFWDSRKDNGLGDISVKQLDILNVYWEPGVTSIQDSRNLFLTELVDYDILEQMYPFAKGKIHRGNSGIDTAKYLYDENIDTSDKAVVVDWYYKVHKENGQTLLHYVKFVDDVVLFASENDPELKDKGFYDHGKYPVIFDTLYPIGKGTPAGYGLVTVCKDPQIYIDALNSNILESAILGSKKRFFVSKSTGINVKDFADWNKPFVEVQGELGEERIREITLAPTANNYLSILQMRIDEMKETSSNRDVSSGGVGAGITSGAAISALQEAGNKTSRDIISASYDCFSEICMLCIELMRQFYDETRAFRIVGANEGEWAYQNLDNSQLKEQPILNAANGQPMVDSQGEQLFRKPIFDIKCQAQKRNPFSTMEANQRASELYGMGFFNPERAQEALPALEMMEFEGKDKVIQTVSQGQTLMKVCQEQMQMIQQLSSALGMATGQQMPQFNGQMPMGTGSASPTPQIPKQRVTNDAGQPMTPYAARLAARSSANMDVQSNAGTPRG